MAWGCSSDAFLSVCHHGSDLRCRRLHHHPIVLLSVLPLCRGISSRAHRLLRHARAWEHEARRAAAGGSARRPRSHTPHTDPCSTCPPCGAHSAPAPGRRRSASWRPTMGGHSSARGCSCSRCRAPGSGASPLVWTRRPPQRQSRKKTKRRRTRTGGSD